MLTGCDNIPKNGIDEKNKIIYVDRAYGSKPNDDTDDAPAIRKAITYAKMSSEKGWTIKLSKGTYKISPEEKLKADPGNKDYALREWVQSCFYFTNIDGLNIEGNETIFELTDPLTGSFTFINSKNLSFSGITFDMQNLPWVQGVVKEVNKNERYFVLFADEGYNILDDPRCKKIYDTLGQNKAITGNVMVKAGELKASCNDHFTINNYEKISDRTYKIKVDASYLNDKFIAQNDKIVINCRTGGGSVFELINGTSNVTIKDITVYASCGSAVLGTRNLGGLTVDNLKVLRKPGTDRLITMQMDGIHYQGLKGPAVITNSIFEGMMDDGINFYQSPITVTSVKSDTEIFLKHRQHKIEAGETLTFYDSASGILKGSAKVASSRTTADNEYYVTLETPVSSVLADNIVYTDALNFNNSVIKNCIFREYRGAGIMARGNNIIIEDNKFENISGIGIDMQNYTNSEGFGATNVTIKNNTFDNIAYMAGNFYGKDVRLAPINIRGTNNSWQYAKSRINNNIVIDSNRFLNLNTQYVIHLSEAESCRIINNEITMKKTSSPPDSIFGNFAVDSYPIFIRNAGNITVSGNTISDTRPWLKAGIFVDGSSTENISQSNNKIN